MGLGIPRERVVNWYAELKGMIGECMGLGIPREWVVNWYTEHKGMIR